MADDKDVKIKITTEGGEQAKTTFTSLIESLGGIGGAVVIANQGLELLQKGFEALEKPIEMINGLANESVNLFKELRGMSAVMGGTLQDAEGMQETFQLAGLSTEKLTFAMFRLSMNVEQGGKELQHLGIEMKNANDATLSTGTIFENVRTKLSGMTDSTERAAEAAKIFGARQARELLPVLSLSAERYEALKKRAEENEAMTKELAAAMGPLIESQANLAQKTEKVRMALAEMIAVPVVQFFTDWLATPAIEFLDHLLQRMKAVNNISAEAAQGRGGFGAFLSALSVRVFGNIEGLDEYVKNIETLNRATDRVRKNQEEAGKQKRKLDEDEIKAATAKEKERYALDIARVKSEASIESELTRIRTDSDSAALDSKLKTNERLIEMANEHYEKERAIAMQRVGPGGKLTAEEEQKLTGERDKEIAKIQAESEKISRVDMLKARIADAKKASDEEVKIIKDGLHERVAATESAAKAETAAIDVTFAPATDKVVSSYRVQATAARDSANAQVDAINQEIESKRKLASAAPQDLHLQRQVADEIRDLNSKRIDAERSADDKIIELRKNLVQQLRSEAEKEAATGQTLEEKALSRLEKRGRKRASQADVEREVAKMQLESQRAAGGYSQGSTVDIAQLREARQLGPTIGALTDEGITGRQAIDLSSQRNVTQLAGEKWSAIPANLQSQVNGYMERLAKVEVATGTALGKMTEAVENMFDAFQNQFIRALEFQAARQ